MDYEKIPPNSENRQPKHKKTAEINLTFIIYESNVCYHFSIQYRVGTKASFRREVVIIPSSSK